MDTLHTDYSVTPSGLSRILRPIIESQRPMMLWGSPGVGKCLRVGTEVIRADGSVCRVEEVQPGDELMGPDSKPRTVLNTTRGFSELYEINPKKGDPWACNIDHILTLKRSPQWPNDPWAGSVRDVPLKDYLRLRKDSKHHLKLFRVPVDFPDENELPVDPYLLGALLGDGCIIHSVRFTNADKEILDTVEVAANAMGLRLSKGAGKYQYSLIVGKGRVNPLTEALRELEVFGQDSGNKFIPEMYRTASEESRLQILAGLIDTDGYLQRTTVEYVSKSPQLAKDVAFIARSLGLLVTRRIKVVNEIEYTRLHISGDVHRIPCRTPRKQAPERQQRKDVLRTGFSVNPIGHGEYYGFELSGDGRFLLEDFTVTHNSAICQQTAEELGYEYHDIRALLLDPVDLRGIPHIDDNGYTRWAPPAFLPPTESEEAHLINLEELPAAPPMIQTSLYQLTLDRKIGEYTLPEKCAVIACGNRENDGGVFHRMPAALRSRMIHIELTVSKPDWMDYAAVKGLATEVYFFIEYEPDLLYQYDPRTKENAFPCPRTWEIVSDLVNTTREISVDALNHEDQRALYTGIIGEAAAIKFLAFLRLRDELPMPGVVLNDPEKAMIPENASALLALCGSIVQYVNDKQVDDMNFEAVCTYALRLRKEIGQFLIGTCVKRNVSLCQTRAFVNYMSKSGKQ